MGRSRFLVAFHSQSLACPQMIRGCDIILEMPANACDMQVLQEQRHQRTPSNIYQNSPSLDNNLLTMQTPKLLQNKIINPLFRIHPQLIPLHQQLHRVRLLMLHHLTRHYVSDGVGAVHGSVGVASVGGGGGGTPYFDCCCVGS